MKVLELLEEIEDIVDTARQNFVMTLKREKVLQESWKMRSRSTTLFLGIR